MMIPVQGQTLYTAIRSYALRGHGIQNSSHASDKLRSWASCSRINFARNAFFSFSRGIGTTGSNTNTRADASAANSEFRAGASKDAFNDFDDSTKEKGEEKTFAQRRKEILEKYGSRLPPRLDVSKFDQFGYKELADRLDVILPKWFELWELMSLVEIEKVFYETSKVKQTIPPISKIKEAKEKKIIPPVVWERNVSPDGKAFGRGTRKRSVASVWISEGTGKFIVNRKPIHEYFVLHTPKIRAHEPLVTAGVAGKFDVNCIVKGGGLSGQADAIRLGLARALQCWNPEHRKALKPAGMLRRDPREVEEKKPGQTKARKKYQWVKR